MKKIIVFVIASSMIVLSFSILETEASSTNQICPKGTSFVSGISVMPPIHGKPFTIITCKLPSIIPKCPTVWETNITPGSNLMTCKLQAH